MKYPTVEYRAREARAKKAVRNLVDHIGLATSDRLELLPPALHAGIIILKAQLVLLASGGSLPFRLEEAVRDSALDLLVMEPGRTTHGTSTFYATILRRKEGSIVRAAALRFWVDVDRHWFLVPDPDGEDADGPCYALEEDGLREAEAAPWTGTVDRGFGLGHADAVLLKP